MPESPLADAVDRFLADPGTTFTVPGHKRSPELADALLQLDLPLVSGADDSRMTGDVLGRAERLAAAALGRGHVPLLGQRLDPRQPGVRAGRCPSRR